MSFAAVKETLAEIGDYLYKRYICLNLSQYQNFELSARNTTVAKVVLMCVLGCMIAAIVLYIDRKYAGQLTRALLEHKCIDEQSAKSAEELGVPVKRRLRYNLRRPSALSKMIYYVGQTHVTAETELLHDVDFRADKTTADAGTEEQPIVQKPRKKRAKQPSYAAAVKERNSVDFQTVGLYIPESLIYRADVRFAGKQESFPVLIATLIALPIAGLIILRFFPQILSLADALITFMNNLLS